MWSPIVLLFLAGLAFASNPGWENNKEYLYRVTAYSVASLDVSNQGSGILFKSLLTLQPQSEKVKGLIKELYYVSINEESPEPSQEWDILNEQFNWMPIEISQSPFEVELQHGRIVSLTVDKQCADWEVNIIKSIMSQFQLNTNGDKMIESHVNTVPENGDNDAVYVVMEDTVTGETETIYNIRPLPDYIVQSRNNEEKYLDLVEQGRVIEVLKHKNYSNSNQVPSYSYGFGNVEWGKPASNLMGEFLMRDSTTRVVLTGSLEKYTIQSSVTVNVIAASPTLSDNDKGRVMSVVNATLEEIKSQRQNLGEISQPVNYDNLVYSYEHSLSSSSNRVPFTQHKKSNNDYHSNQIRPRRSINRQQYPEGNDNKPQLNQAPTSQLLPYTIGYEGMSIKEKINIVQEVQKLVKNIGKQMQDLEKTHHEQLLDQYQTMISLMRIMNFDELQEVAKYVYTTKYEGEERANWVAFRDGVAELGTGPALLCVSDWLKTNKLSGEEANQVVATMTDVVRQPTDDYIKSLFELSRSQEIQNQWPVNNTILLGLTDIIRRVYVDHHQSEQRFPVEGFGSFYSAEGQRYIDQEIIPYISEQLKEAIENSETHKIHSLIRIIANTGSYNFLKEFEPYLEGRKSATQFQRVLMVLAMSKLVDNHPETARAVLYRIYQNPGDVKEVRMAAVYQLMRTVPPVEMLQDMAAYTQIDSDDYVNAAVISSIETASELEGYQFQELQKAAETARPLLAKDKTYGVRHGANYLRTYVVEELSKVYKETTQLFGSDDSRIPGGVIYSLRQHMGGVRERVAEIIALVSSVDDLFQVAREQTREYENNEKEQKQRSQEQESNPWSSQNIAKLLQIQTEVPEQLEAFMFMELSKQYYMFGFDNNTFEQLPEALREWEQELKNGKEINMYKLRTEEKAIAFPTALGLPFLFTHDQPMLIKAQGKFKLSAQPSIIENGKMNVPDQVDVRADDIKLTVSSKLQSRLSFTIPFHHEQYIAGFDKHVQFNIPVQAQMQVDMKEMNANVEFEINANQDVPLWHYSTVPYITKRGLTDFGPISKSQYTKVIKQYDLQSYEANFGKQSTGMDFHVKVLHSRRFLDTLTMSRILTQQGLWDAIKSIWDDNSIQYSEYDVTFRPESSENHKAIIRVSYENVYKSRAESSSNSEWILNENIEPAQRQEELIRKISSDIKNVQTVSLDATVEFEGQKKIKYVLTGAVAKSNVDPKSRAIVSYKRRGDVHPHEFHVEVNSYIPNTNSLDLDFTLQNEPMTNNEVKIKFGYSKESLSRIDAQFNHRRSSERKHYLKQLPAYKQCKNEMKVGNNQLPACANITQDANLLDYVSVKVNYENLDDILVDYIQAGFQALKVFSYPSVETLNRKGSVQGNEINVNAAFHPDLQALNVSVITQKEENIFENIPIDQLTKEILVLHPVFNLRTRLASYVYELDTYRPFCAVEKTHISTFSNLTYPADISKQWTLLLQYIIGNSYQNQEPIQNQLKQQLEHFVILARESSESPNNKDVKVVVSSPQTNFKIVEINITPNQQQNRNQPRVVVTVNGQQIPVSDKESYDVNNGYVQIYALPNGEVKVEVDQAFYITCDGKRVKITAVDGKFENRIFGACGQFTEQITEDMWTSEACIARHPEEFIRSLEVEGQAGQKARASFRENPSKCVEKVSPSYVDVITPNDYRSKQGVYKSNRCSYYQTKYQEQNGKICFTIHPQLTCSSSCRPGKQIRKNLPVNCVARTMGDTWKDQIDNGSSPDVGKREQQQMMSFSLPESCSS
nr:vitellogenin [Ophraella communa]